MKINAYGAASPCAPLAPMEIDRYMVGQKDCLIEIMYCGVCFTDVHMVCNDWNETVYPVVPGHEITGYVRRIGKDVKSVEVDDPVAVGIVTGSCGGCKMCENDQHQYCKKVVKTFNSRLPYNRTTCGGFSTHIVVQERFVFKLSKNLPLDGAAPLICAGITVYSPLRRYKINEDSSVCVLGFGGLGHLALKVAAAMGARVTVVSRSRSKLKDALRMGAHWQIIGFGNLPENAYHVVIDTLSVSHDLNPVLKSLVFDGVLVMVGIPNHDVSFNPGNAINGRRCIIGSSAGGAIETKEFLQFCATNNIVAEVERIDIRDINVAFDRIKNNDVKYRLVADLSTLERTEIDDD